MHVPGRQRYGYTRTGHPDKSKWAALNLSSDEFRSDEFRMAAISQAP
jgi:hypothetical protein